MPRPKRPRLDDDDLDRDAGQRAKHAAASPPSSSASSTASSEVVVIDGDSPTVEAQPALAMPAPPVIVDLTADDDDDPPSVILISPTEARIARQEQERLERTHRRRRQQELLDRQAALELQRREDDERRRRAVAESDRLLAEQLAAEDLMRQRQASGGASSAPAHHRNRVPASHVVGSVATRARVGRHLPGSWWSSAATAGGGGSMDALAYGRNLAELAQWLADDALSEVLGLRLPGEQYQQEAPESYEDLLALSERIGVVKRGLSTGEINALPRIKHTRSSTDLTSSKDDDNDNRDCAICMAEFSQGDDVLLMPNCLHRFHAACIRPWLSENRTCPVCRVNVI